MQDLNEEDHGPLLSARDYMDDGTFDDARLVSVYGRQATTLALTTLNVFDLYTRFLMHADPAPPDVPLRLLQQRVRVEIAGGLPVRAAASLVQLFSRVIRLGLPAPTQQVLRRLLDFFSGANETVLAQLLPVVPQLLACLSPAALVSQPKAVHALVVDEEDTIERFIDRLGGQSAQMALEAGRVDRLLQNLLELGVPDAPLVLPPESTLLQLRTQLTPARPARGQSAHFQVAVSSLFLPPTRFLVLDNVRIVLSGNVHRHATQVLVLEARRHQLAAGNPLVLDGTTAALPGVSELSVSEFRANIEGWPFDLLPLLMATHRE